MRVCIEFFENNDLYNILRNNHDKSTLGNVIINNLLNHYNDERDVKILIDSSNDIIFLQNNYNLNFTPVLLNVFFVSVSAKMQSTFVV